MQRMEILVSAKSFASHNRILALLPPGNEVAGRLCFYRCPVILLTEGVSASVHAGIPPPPGADTPPPADPPGSRPPLEQAPPWSRPPPGPEHAGRYGQRAGGTHPTGMQSCDTWSFMSCIIIVFISITATEHRRNVTLVLIRSWPIISIALYNM